MVGNNEEVKEHENVQDKKIFSCEYCNFTSKWKHNIKKHERFQHGNEIILFSCEYCEYTSRYKENIKRHEKTQHQKEEIVYEVNLKSQKLKKLTWI